MADRTRVGQTVQPAYANPFFKKHHCNYKRIRKRPKGKCDKDYYNVKLEQLSLLETQYEKGWIDLYYGDESQVSEEGYVPYGWQFSDESVCIESAKGAHINCFGLLARDNRFFYQTTTENITSDFVIGLLDRVSFQIKKQTVVVLDNAKIHQSKKVKAMLPIWAKRGLFLFFLPPYSPHLNIIERFWKELKGRWLTPKDYHTKEQLFYSTKLIFEAVGKSLFIDYKPFQFVLR
ncbi:IS630 family transposase [Parasediminibacterium sp. JCM 36343]|uniref:IS630 family transposase n=1 Tax=Parasediminibacterium sp. JCM 36343 TaxID=3374279 RepID=UPI00397E3096